jgi:hypothetical protein
VEEGGLSPHDGKRRKTSLLFFSFLDHVTSSLFMINFINREPPFKR